MKKLNNTFKYDNYKNLKVSIGMPVYNGEKYLKEALDSILAQTYQDFEIIIADNASTDDTQKICQYYTNKDERIHYYRNKRNIGATLNHNKVFKLANGIYFKWAAHDDILDRDFLLKCINKLDQEPSLVICTSKTSIINENSEVIGNYNFPIKINSRNPHDRYGAIIRDIYNSWVLLLGVIRTSSLLKTQLFGNFVGADNNLVAELSLMGRIYEIPEYLFFRRKHPQAYTESKRMRSPQENLKWWTQISKINFPYVKIFLEYIRSIRRVPMRYFDRILCYLETIKWFFSKGWILICYDVAMNLGVDVGKYFNSKFMIEIIKRMNFSMGREMK